MAVLVPADQPGNSLIALIRTLSASPVPAIVVDDGSGSEFAATFERVQALPRVTVLHHANNQPDLVSTKRPWRFEETPQC
jgi:hypothetical protein